MSVGAAGPHVGVISPWRSEALAGHARELLWSGVERPCSAGIRSERVEALGGRQGVRPGRLW